MCCLLENVQKNTNLCERVEQLQHLTLRLDALQSRKRRFHTGKRNKREGWKVYGIPFLFEEEEELELAP